MHEDLKRGHTERGGEIRGIQTNDIYPFYKSNTFLRNQNGTKIYTYPLFIFKAQHGSVISARLTAGDKCHTNIYLYIDNGTRIQRKLQIRRANRAHLKGVGLKGGRGGDLEIHRCCKTEGKG
jgi:hypothetical protein